MLARLSSRHVINVRLPGVADSSILCRIPFYGTKAVLSRNEDELHFNAPERVLKRPAVGVREATGVLPSVIVGRLDLNLRRSFSSVGHVEGTRDVVDIDKDLHVQDSNDNSENCGVSGAPDNCGSSACDKFIDCADISSGYVTASERRRLRNAEKKAKEQEEKAAKKVTRKTIRQSQHRVLHYAE